VVVEHGEQADRFEVAFDQGADALEDVFTAADAAEPVVGDGDALLRGNGWGWLAIYHRA
jgi:hypothetical protein